MLPPPVLWKIPVWEAILCHLAVCTQESVLISPLVDGAAVADIPSLLLTPGLASSKAPAGRTPGRAEPGRGGQPPGAAWAGRGGPGLACPRALAPYLPSPTPPGETGDSGAGAGGCTGRGSRGRAPGRGFRFLLPPAPEPRPAPGASAAAPPPPAGPRWPFAAAARAWARPGGAAGWALPWLGVAGARGRKAGRSKAGRAVGARARGPEGGLSLCGCRARACRRPPPVHVLQPRSRGAGARASLQLCSTPPATPRVPLCLPRWARVLVFSVGCRVPSLRHPRRTCLAGAGCPHPLAASPAPSTTLGHAASYLLVAFSLRPLSVPPPGTISRVFSPFTRVHTEPDRASALPRLKMVKMRQLLFPAGP